MAEAGGGAQPPFLVSHLAQQLVGVQAAFHEGPRLAKPAEDHGLLRRFMAVGSGSHSLTMAISLLKPPYVTMERID